MRRFDAIFGITALAAVVFSPLPAAAFGFHLGRFYFHLPFVGHHYHRHHLMRANPHEARARPNDALAAVAMAPPPAGATPPSRLIARRALNPTPRRSKVAPV